MIRRSDKNSDSVKVSVVVPLFCEQDNVAPLCERIKATLDTQPPVYEVIFVDDGSTDDTVARLREAIGADARMIVLELTRNFGQTAALTAGFHHARGDVIVPMDGDLQNDPADIPHLVAKLDEPPGWDIVSGWRVDRQDGWLRRRIPSKIANWLIKRLTWTTEVHDFGCTLKAYRREVLEDVHLYGEMHRFLPAICKWRGARVTELPVRHQPRVAGKSKYGLKRIVKVLLDLLTVKFLGDYLSKPIYFFGKVAIGLMLLAFAAVALAVVQKYGYLTEHGHPVMLNDNIFVLFSMMTCLMSIMFLMLGVISELLVRIYYESQGRTPYKVRNIHRGQTAGQKQLTVSE